MAGVGTGLAYTLALLCALSGVPKIFQFRAFRLAVADYKLLPPWVTPVFAALVCAIELACACSLAIGGGVKPAAIVLSALLAVYAGAQIVTLARRSDVACHCFEIVRKSRLTPASVVRTAIMLLYAATLASGRITPEGPSLASVVFAVLLVVPLAVAELIGAGLELAVEVQREYAR